MSAKTQKVQCGNCHSEISGNYCSQCGSPQTLKRINGAYILSEIGRVINFDKGLLFTIKELVVRPGITVQNFIHKDRNRLVKPIIFLIICSLIYTIAQELLRFEDGYINAGGFEEPTIALMIDYIQSNYGYLNILMAVFIAIWIKIFFRKYPYNFFEVLILLCFVIGIGMLIYTVLGIAESLTNLNVLHFAGFIGAAYISWGIGSFFDKNKKINYLKAILSYILGMITFSMLLILLGLLISLGVK
jgi:hypothetical protein